MAKITFQSESTDNLDVYINGKKEGTITEKSKSFTVAGGSHKFQFKNGPFYRSKSINFSVDDEDEIKYTLTQTSVIKKLLSFNFPSAVWGILGVFGALVFGTAIGLNKGSSLMEWMAVSLGFFIIFFLITWIAGKRIKVVKYVK